MPPMDQPIAALNLGHIDFHQCINYMVVHIGLGPRPTCAISSLSFGIVSSFLLPALYIQVNKTMHL